MRPVTGETRRWGPVSEAGEYAFDVPHLFGTRRIGPDLTRVGLKYSDEWHLAHFWDPRMLSPDSIMSSYRGLFDTPEEPVRIVDDGAGGRTLERTPVTQRLFDFTSQDADLRSRRIPKGSCSSRCRRAPRPRHPDTEQGVHWRHGQDRRRDEGSSKV